MRTIFLKLPLLLAGLMISSAGISQAQHDDKITQDYLDKVIKLHKENLKRYAKHDHILVKPGLVADKKKQRVEIYVETTQASAGGDVEFFLVGHESSHGYEAMAWSFARPAAVHEALQFIGMTRGLPVDVRKLRFVAKGERVIASFAPLGEEDATTRLESTLLDTRNDKPMAEDGFIYTGSLMVPTTREATNMVLAADYYDPFSIIPMFNDPFAIMDVPWTMSQGEVFQNMEATNHDLAPHTLMKLILEPAIKDGKKGVVELVLRVDMEKGYLLKDKDGDIINEDPTLETVIDTLGTFLTKGQTPHLQPDFDKALKLDRMRDLATIIELLKIKTNIMIEPPKEGQLYYKAFLPAEAGRKVEGRLTQPWELHLDIEKHDGKALLVIHEETWKEGQLDPDLTRHEFPVNDAKAARASINDYLDKLKEAGKRRPPEVILAFAPLDQTYDELLAWLAPLMTTHKTIYVYLDEEEATSDAEKPEQASEEPKAAE